MTGARHEVRRCVGCGLFDANMERWRGRVALVTGASSGIGRAIAVRLLGLGLNVVACAERLDGMESIRSEPGASGHGAGQLLAVKCDVSKEDEILSMFEQVRASEWRGVDVCINNAGVAYRGKLWEAPTHQWSEILNVNVLGLAICTREALKSMRERSVDDGHIVHISSIMSREVWPDLVMYTASKHAVGALTEGLRQELLAEKSGIRVTAVNPGVVRTAILDRSFGYNKEMVREFLAANNHLAPADVAGAVEYVLSTPPHVQVHDIIVRPVANPPPQ